MNIQHNPLSNIEKIIAYYSEKDGVPIQYVCTSALGSSEFALDIFYRQSPHPKYGNRYFGLNSIMITNADAIEDQNFAMIEDSQGKLHYSSHRHDYKEIDGKVIDGGRAYVRTNTSTICFKVKDGKFVKVD